MGELFPSYLTGLHVVDAFSVKDLTIELGNPPHELRHLVLTGPNGSGKSSILRGLATALDPILTQPRRPHEVNKASDSEHRPLVRPKLARQAESIRSFAYLPALRQLELRAVKGPKRFDLNSRRAARKTPLSRLFLQYLVNERTEQALAREDGDEATAERIATWFDTFETKLREIFADDKLRLELDRQRYEYLLYFDGARPVSFEQLPDGFASVLNIWAEIILQRERFEHFFQAEVQGGIVLIDEVELHLHAELQEQLLPFLTTLFPTHQFIVTTHSPAVAASLDNATIFDLRTREAISSEELRGLRYGSIFTEWFGIETDFDLRTTRELRELQALAKAKPERGSPEYARMRELADDLADRSHLLAMYVQRALDRGDD